MKKTPEALANMISRGENVPIDVARLAEKNGAVVLQKCGLEERGLAGLSLKNELHRVISVNNSLNRQKRRFMLAHELGHIICSTEQQNIIVDSDYGKALSLDSEDRHEREATLFAISLLIPKKNLLLSIKSINEKKIEFSKMVKLLAEEYDTEEWVIMFRIARLFDKM